MAERSETDKIIQAPAKVILGGKEYEVKPLPVKYSMPWVKKTVGLLKSSAGLLAVSSDDKEHFYDALNSLMVDKPELIINLFWEYARDLNRNEIEETATSYEILNAFDEVLELERPLLGSLVAKLNRIVGQ